MSVGQIVMLVSGTLGIVLGLIKGIVSLITKDAAWTEPISYLSTPISICTIMTFGAFFAWYLGY